MQIIKKETMTLRGEGHTWKGLKRGEMREMLKGEKRSGGDDVIIF